MQIPVYPVEYLSDMQAEQTQNLAIGHQFTTFLQQDDVEQENETGKDCLQMYMEVAATALQHIDKYDPSTAKTIKGVVDYLVSDSRLKPEELDNQRKISAEALFQVNELTKENKELRDLLFDKNSQCNQQDKIIENLKEKITEYEVDLDMRNKTIDDIHRSNKDLMQKNQNFQFETLDIRKQRDQAMKRQNQILAANIEQKTSIEKAIADMNACRTQLKNAQENERFIRQQLAERILSVEQLRSENAQYKFDLKELEVQSSQTISNFMREVGQLKEKLFIEINEKNIIAQQQLAMNDQIYKLQVMNSTKQKQIEKYIENQNMGNPGSYSVRGAINVQTSNQYVQVSTQLRKKPYDQDKYVEQLIGDEMDRVEQLQCIDAEMSQTSGDEFNQYNKNFDEPIQDNDEYNNLLAKVKQQFVKKNQYDLVKKKYNQLISKYSKYKQKYSTISVEVLIQSMLSQYTAIDQSIKQMDDALQKIIENDKVPDNFKKDYQALRLSLETKLLRVHEDVQKESQKLDVSNLKLLDGVNFERKSKAVELDNYIMEQATHVQKFAPSAQILVMNIKNCLENPTNKIIKLQDDMTTQNKLLKNSSDIQQAAVLAQKMNQMLQTKAPVNEMKNTKVVQTEEEAQVTQKDFGCQTQFFIQIEQIQKQIVLQEVQQVKIENQSTQTYQVMDDEEVQVEILQNDISILAVPTMVEKAVQCYIENDPDEENFLKQNEIQIKKASKSINCESLQNLVNNEQVKSESKIPQQNTQLSMKSKHSKNQISRKSINLEKIDESSQKSSQNTKIKTSNSHRNSIVQDSKQQINKIMQQEQTVIIQQQNNQSGNEELQEEHQMPVYSDPEIQTIMEMHDKDIQTDNKILECKPIINIEVQQDNKSIQTSIDTDLSVEVAEIKQQIQINQNSNLVLEKYQKHQINYNEFQSTHIKTTQCQKAEIDVKELPSDIEFEEQQISTVIDFANKEIQTESHDTIQNINSELELHQQPVELADQQQEKTVQLPQEVLKETTSMSQQTDMLKPSNQQVDIKNSSFQTEQQYTKNIEIQTDDLQTNINSLQNASRQTTSLKNFNEYYGSQVNLNLDNLYNVQQKVEMKNEETDTNNLIICIEQQCQASFQTVSKLVNQQVIVQQNSKELEEKEKIISNQQQTIKELSKEIRDLRGIYEETLKQLTKLQFEKASKQSVLSNLNNPMFNFSKTQSSKVNTDSAEQEAKQEVKVKNPSFCEEPKEVQTIISMNILNTLLQEHKNYKMKIQQLLDQQKNFKKQNKVSNIINTDIENQSQEGDEDEQDKYEFDIIDIIENQYQNEIQSKTNILKEKKTSILNTNIVNQFQEMLKKKYQLIDTTNVKDFHQLDYNNLENVDYKLLKQEYLRQKQIQEQNRIDELNNAQQQKFNVDSYMLEQYEDQQNTMKQQDRKKQNFKPIISKEYEDAQHTKKRCRSKQLDRTLHLMQPAINQINDAKGYLNNAQQPQQIQSPQSRDDVDLQLQELTKQKNPQYNQLIDVAESEYNIKNLIKIRSERQNLINISSNILPANQVLLAKERKKLSVLLGTCRTDMSGVQITGHSNYSLQQQMDQMPVIKIKCKRQKIIQGNDVNNQYYNFKDNYKQQIEQLNAPMVKEYKFENGKFISPFKDVLDLRQKLKIQNIMKKRRQQQKQQDAVNLLVAVSTEQHNNFNLNQFTSHKDYQLAINNQQLEQQYMMAFQQNHTSVQNKVQQNQLLQFIITPNLLKQYQNSTLQQPQSLNSIELQVLKRHKLLNLKLMSFKPLILVKQQLQIQQLQNYKNNIDAEPGSTIYYVQIDQNYSFSQFFNQQQFKTLPQVQVTDQSNLLLTYLRLPNNTIIKQLTWLLRSIRLFYYECANSDQSLMNAFTQWACQKFTNTLLLNKFICSFYATFVYYLGVIIDDSKRILDKRLNDSVCSEILLFYQLFNIELSDIFTTFLAFRKILMLDQQNPNFQTYEEQLNIQIVENYDFIQNHMQLNHNTCKQFEKFLTSYYQNIKDKSQEYSKNNNLTTHVQLYILIQLNIQQKIKQILKFVYIFDEELQKKNKDEPLSQTIGKDKIINMLQSQIKYLSKAFITQLIYQYSIHQQFNEFDMMQYIEMICKLFLNSSFSNCKGKDNILTKSMQKFQVCQQIIHQIMNSNQQDGENQQLFNQFRDELQQLDQCVNQIKYHLSQRNSLQSFYLVNQLYGQVIKYQQLTNQQQIELNVQYQQLEDAEKAQTLEIQ